MLSRPTLDGLAAHGSGGGNEGGDLKRQRLELRLGYGFGVLGGRFTMTPEAGIGLSDAGRDYRFGWRLRRGPGPGALELSLKAARRESANEDAPPEHGIRFRVTARW